ncbi:Phosphoglucan phosphatase LSF1, chloroplastic [Linum perenne]
MASLQPAGCSTGGGLFRERTFSYAPFPGRDLNSFGLKEYRSHVLFASGIVRAKRVRTRDARICAMSATNGASSSPAMHLNEYMVTLDRPLGIRFALSLDGKIIVHSLKRGGNAERTRIIMVGDTLKKAGGSSGSLMVISDIGEAQKVLLEDVDSNGQLTLVLERPTFPFPIHLLDFSSDLGSFNRGRVAMVTWNKSMLASHLQSNEETGSSGFAAFSWNFLTHHGWKLLNDRMGRVESPESRYRTQVVSLLSEDVSGDGEWAHGNFPLEEYIGALERSKDELYYDHSLGMHYTKVTEQIFLGSCLQKEEDVKRLSRAGITAVINFQGPTEAENWGINLNSINESCQRSNILMINYPIRDVDSFDLRKKLPFAVGLLFRLLRKNHHVFVTCTTGFDRSPACVVAYLHWITDTSLHAAYNYVTGFHVCKPDRAAIAWATWDLFAMVESGVHDGPATHAVTFVWTGQEGEDVSLVGSFTGNWKEPIRATHKGGPRYEVELRLAQGKYYYKYIINGDWRHSTYSPTERDESGNLNNVLVLGEPASIRHTVKQNQKDVNIVKVIERGLTESERFTLAKAGRCIAFSVCPLRLAPK